MRTSVVIKRLLLSAMNVIAACVFVYLSHESDDFGARPFILMALSCVFIALVLWSPNVQLWMVPALMLLTGVLWLWWTHPASLLIKAGTTLLVIADVWLSFGWLARDPDEPPARDDVM